MNNIEIQNSIGIFHNIMIDILRRRELFRAFEKHLVNKTTKKNAYENSFVSFYIMDYVRGQLIDLRKFFETDKSSYKISELVKFIGNTATKEKHESLYKIWKNKYSGQVNMAIAHIDKTFRDITKEINKDELDLFINDMNSFMDDIIAGLKLKGNLEINNKFRENHGKLLTDQETRSFKEYIEWVTKK